MAKRRDQKLGAYPLVSETSGVGYYKCRTRPSAGCGIEKVSLIPEIVL